MLVEQKRWADHQPAKFDWEVLVTEGHVWVARINRLLKRTPFWAACLFLALLSHDIVSSTALLSSRLISYQSDESAPGAVQKFVMSPLNSVQSAATDSPAELMASNPAPELDLVKVESLNNFALAPLMLLNQTDRVALGVQVEKMRVAQNSAWITKIITSELDSLNRTGKLAPLPMVPLQNLSENWYATVEQSASPVSKIGKDGVIWLGSVIMDVDGKIRPQIGAFKRTAGKYGFFNVAFNAQFAVLKDFPTVPVADIPRQIGADFPDLIKGRQSAANNPRSK